MAVLSRQLRLAAPPNRPRAALGSRPTPAGNACECGRAKP